jgi:nitrogen regulatory protein PII
MKLITAVIKPFKLEEVREALERIGAHGAMRIRTGETGDDAL